MLTLRTAPRLIAILLATCAPTSAAAAALDVDEPFDFIWSTGQVKLVSQKGHSDWVRALAVFPDGRRLASAGNDRTIRISDVAAKTTLLILRTENPVSAVAVSPDGRKLLSLETDASARLWDAESGRELLGFKVGTYDSQLRFTPDGKSAITLSGNQYVFWDLATGAKQRFVQIVPEPDYSKNYDTSDSRPECAATSADARVALSRTKKNARLVDLETGAVVRTWQDPIENYDCGAAFSPDGGRLLTGAGRVVRLLDVATGKELAKFKLDSVKWSEVRGLEFSRDGSRFSLKESAGFSVRDTAGLKKLFRHDYAAGAFSTDGKKIFNGGYLGDLESFEINEARTTDMLFPHAESATVHVSSYAGPGGYIYTGEGVDRELFAVTNKAHKACAADIYDNGFALIAKCLRAMQSQGLEGEPLPSAPVLSQGAYESKADFDARVDAAKKTYEAALAARTAKLAAWKRPVLALPVSFLAFFGWPAVGSGIAYDPETRTFTFKVQPMAWRGGDYHLRLALRETVPNDKAEAFEKRLAAAAPTVSYRVRDGEFTLQGVSLNIDGKHYPAYPTDADVARTLARVDVGEAVAKPADPAAPEVSAGYSEDPELAAKQRELAGARKKQATAEQLAKLEAEIARLTGAATPQYRSDVDEPVVARPEDPAAYAVVVGVESYQMSDLPKARFAERDARSMARRLEALGVPPRNMKVLVGSDATRSKLAAVLEQWLPERATAASKVYFYFSGHGAPDPVTGDSYLVPWDGDPSLLKRTGYPLSALYADLGKVPAARRVALLDSCFSGSGGRSLLAKGARPLVNVLDTGSGSVTVLAAASASQITATAESQGHGLFTYHLLKSLGAGGRAASAVYAELKPKVQDDAARQSREQTPIFSGPDAPIP